MTNLLKIEHFVLNMNFHFELRHLRKYKKISGGDSLVECRQTYPTSMFYSCGEIKTER